MFLKIVKGTTIVDATDTLNYVRENPRNKALISCEAILAAGAWIWRDTLHGVSRQMQVFIITLFFVRFLMSWFHLINGALLIINKLEFVN